MSARSLKLLRSLTPLSALGSLVAHGLAVFTNEWLHSVELMPNPNYKKFSGASDEFLNKNTSSGLWVLCKNEPGIKSMNCSKIDYFSDEEYSPDPNDSTMAIPYAAKRAAIFISLSTAVLILAVFLYLLSCVCKKKRVFTFASGIAFILSGLLILAGIVIYISTFKAEVGNKLRPKSSFQGPLFQYNYGYSFMFAVASLMMCEIVGTCSIFLYIRVHQLEWKKEFEKQQYIEYLAPPTISVPEPSAPSVIYCKKHGGRGRRYSRTKELSRDPSPIHPGKGSRTPSLTVPGTNIPLSDSMRDLTYFTFPASSFSRETTCNTVSTSVDINRDYSREFSPRRESLFRTEYPPPIHEQEFLENEYSQDYNSRGDYSRRTTPV